MKICNKSLLLALLAFGFGACAPKPNDPVSEADVFFRLISENKAKEAYESASFRFQAEQSLAAFEARIKECGLAGVGPIAWTARPAKNGEIGLDAQLERSKTRIVVKLAKQSGEWKVCALKVESSADSNAGNFSLVGQGAGFVDVSSIEIPKVVILKKLVADALLEFNKATQTKSFAAFSKTVSATWQSQLTEKRLMDAFGPWMEAGVDLSGIKPEELEFMEPPRLTPEGLLILKGSFPVQSQRLVFSMQFMYELPKWRLFGLDLSMVSS